MTEKRAKLPPDEALRSLMEGNERFASGTMNARQDLSALRKQTAEKQEPFATVLACSDSRVPVELIFDQTIGQLFVARVAGNVVTPEILGSIEYGVAVLGTSAILVLGHSSCGAVGATMHGGEVTGQIGSLFPHIQPAVDKANGNLEKAIKENARMQADRLGSSPVLSGLVKEGKLEIVAGYYDLATGGVSLIGN